MNTTKLLSGIAIFALAFTSCQSDQKLNQQDIVKQNLEAYVVPKLHAPDTYIFTELKLVDSIRYSDNIQYRKNYFQRHLKADMANLEKQEKHKTENPSLYSEDKVVTLSAEIEKTKKILSEIDRISNQLGDQVNDIASYTYRYTFKSKSNKGKQGDYEYIIQTNPSPSFKVINLATRAEDVLLNPNDFPGYKEMIKNYN